MGAISIWIENPYQLHCVAKSDTKLKLTLVTVLVLDRFWNFFCYRLSSKLMEFPPHPIHFATLLCEILLSENKAKIRHMVVYLHIWDVVGFSAIISLQIYCWICWQKATFSVDENLAKLHGRRLIVLPTVCTLSSSYEEFARLSFLASLKSRFQNGFTRLVPAYTGCREKESINGCQSFCRFCNRSTRALI